MTKDYYRILGVLDDAEDIVIRAAYKVLAQKYHPDKWKGDKAEATQRMSEINEAYGVLSNVEKRKQYDSIRDKAEYQEDANEEDNADFNKSLEKDWKNATEYFPDLIELAKNLAKISQKLEYTFKVIIIEQKAFNTRFELANDLEKQFLRKYFGSNPQVLKFAKELIMRNQKDAAKELNKAVNLLGSEVDPNIIIEKIVKKFSQKNNTHNVSDDDLDHAKIYANSLINSPSVYYGKFMIMKLGGIVSRPSMNADIDVSYKLINKKMSEKEFISFALDIANNL